MIFSYILQPIFIYLHFKLLYITLITIIKTFNFAVLVFTDKNLVDDVIYLTQKGMQIIIKIV